MQVVASLESMTKFDETAVIERFVNERCIELVTAPKSKKFLQGSTDLRTLYELGCTIWSSLVAVT
jgi:hypothetical protein